MIQDWPATVIRNDMTTLVKKSGETCQTDVIPILALARALIPMRIRTGARAGARRSIGKIMSNRDRVAELSTAIANQIRSTYPLSN